jgi:hypothetical protein
VQKTNQHKIIFGNLLVVGFIASTGIITKQSGIGKKIKCPVFYADTLIALWDHNGIIVFIFISVPVSVLVLYGY